ncbi:hypothetical protein BTJ40_14165 [Microbulbifer sp. A4B17]|nr:hypothetical protein BTJ40_14165 [Microbulbifer sp. A4B17]
MNNKVFTAGGNFILKSLAGLSAGILNLEAVLSAKHVDSTLLLPSGVSEYVLGISNIGQGFEWL